jgi:hypothetical protein
MTRRTRPAPRGRDLEAIARHPRVTGALLVGSAGRDAAGPDSDIDLVLVVRGMDPPLVSAMTWADGRLLDVAIVADEVVRRHLAQGAVPPRTYWHGGIADWARDGRVLADPEGLIARVRAIAPAASVAPAEADLHAAWYAGWYALYGLRRLLASRDPATRLHVALRLGHIAHQAAQFHPMLRGAPWAGSRDNLRALAREDPATFALLERCCAEPDLTRRWALAAELMERVTAPVGPWPEGETSAGFQRGVRLDDERLARGLDLVEELLRGAP